jgi:citrate lyase subunit beta / citryl-CoA lyase
MWPIRSALFVPAHRRDWVGKAIRVSPGAAVLDIEDSVPPEFKPRAMVALSDAAGSRGRFPNSAGQLEHRG